MLHQRLPALLQARAEQEKYLHQLEEEGRAQEVYGKGMQLIMPSPSFVAKTANSRSGQKVFINVCTSDKVKRCPGARHALAKHVIAFCGHSLAGDACLGSFTVHVKFMLSSCMA